MFASGSKAAAGSPLSGTVYWAAEVDNGDSGATKTIDLMAGNKQKLTLTANCTFTFDPEPAGPCNLILRLIQGGSGSYTVTWPADVNSTGNALPTLSTGVGDVDLLSLYYDGSEFHVQAMLDSRNS